MNKELEESISRSRERQILLAIDLRKAAHPRACPWETASRETLDLWMRVAWRAILDTDCHVGVALNEANKPISPKTLDPTEQGE